MLSHRIYCTGRGHIVASCGVRKTKISRRYAAQNKNKYQQLSKLLGGSPREKVDSASHKINKIPSVPHSLPRKLCNANRCINRLLRKILRNISTYFWGHLTYVYITILIQCGTKIAPLHGTKYYHKFLPV